MFFRAASAMPSGAKARIICVLIGTAEAVPYPNPIWETSSEREEAAFLVLPAKSRFLVASLLGMTACLVLPDV
jgi:hypothetical protein